jgi:hypothetical protein
LDAPVITHQAVQDADCLIVGGPAIAGGMCATVRHFLDGLAEFQANGCLLKGKVGAVFTSTGGEPASCYGGHEAVLASVHATFLQHSMVRALRHHVRIASRVLPTRAPNGQPRSQAEASLCVPPPLVVGRYRTHRWCWGCHRPR